MTLLSHPLRLSGHIAVWHRNPRLKQIEIALIGLIVCQPLMAATASPGLKSLPQKIAKRCKTPVNWVVIHGKDEIHIQPSVDAKYEKVDCVLAQLNKVPHAKLGFVGNEADPNAVLKKPFSYIIEGPKAQISTLTEAARADGWVIVRSATSEDGITFLILQTRSGETWGSADLLLQRIWKKEFGDISLAMAPRPISEADPDQ